MYSSPAIICRAFISRRRDCELGSTLMRVTLVFLIVVMCGCSRPENSDQTVNVSTITSTQMIEDLHQYCDIARQGWAYLKSKQSTDSVNLSAIRDKLVSRVSEETTREQFADLLREFAASLHDGHSVVNTTHLKDPAANTWPIGFLDVAEGIVVGNLNWLKDNPGIELGDRLMQVNHSPVEVVLEHEMSFTSASTDASRRLLALDGLHRTGDTSVRFLIERSRGDTLEVELPCLRGQVDFRYRERKSFCAKEFVAGKYPLIRIPQFTWNAPAFLEARTDRDRDTALAEAKQHIDAAFFELQNDDGLILDLRGNSGGFELLSSYVAEHLVEGDFVYYTITRNDSPYTRLLAAFEGMDSGVFGNPLPQYPCRWQGIRHLVGPRFLGRMVVLVDSRCFSTTDNLCAFLRDNRPHTRFLGQPTGAGTGEPVTVGVLKHSGAAIQFCVSEIHSPAGRRIEGVGTLPDRLVERTRNDVINRKDPFIEAAVNELDNW